MDQNELPQGKRTGSSAWSSPTCVRFGWANVQTPPNSDRNCTFPWWMDTPIWSRPAGAISTKVEAYFRKFGCYPSAVLADRIYQTRRNKMFCTKLGIRLSGPPPGRRKASETDAKIKRQINRDACDRNAIEG